jgi:hypothetical protein
MLPKCNNFVPFLLLVKRGLIVGDGFGAIVLITAPAQPASKALLIRLLLAVVGEEPKIKGFSRILPQKSIDKIEMFISSYDCILI